ncbi:MAG: hypothetical protein JW718_00050 [Desulfovibrionaceae bacterium]|nr:hypothetical protein [Desulfovibrionaceae bacterium]
MQKIPLKLARPGMKLAKPVVSDSGMTLMAEGMELSDGLIMRLENMKVERIVVQGNPVDLAGVGGGTKFAERVERLDHLFRGLDGDGWMMEVKGHLRSYFQIKAAAQEAEEAEKQAKER